jgi:NAD(P)-dependent dehydrogenase (short-subunit alcohol dehydrogenase family)
MSNRLHERIAIITGAGQGIGEGIARRFAQSGARVIVAEINPATGAAVAAALQADGYPVHFIQTDVADPAQIERMVAETVDTFGPPDILVNNAGINVFNDPLQLTDAEWDRCFSIDLLGVWHCCRAVLPHMLASGRGSIVNIASVHSFQIIPHTFPYPVAKHGLLGMTRALAVEYAAQGVRVNAICPGWILTQINVDYWNTFPDPAAERSRTERRQPMQRIGTVDEVAWPAVFLASDEAGFITGAMLVIDGGKSIQFDV